MSVHRNPNAKPYTKFQTGSARRGNANANTQARNRLTNTLKTVSNTVKQTIISNTKPNSNNFNNRYNPTTSVSKKTSGKKLDSNNRAFSGGYNYNYSFNEKSDFNPTRYGRVRGKMNEESRRFYDALTNKNSKYEIVKNKKTNKTYTIDKVVYDKNLGKFYDGTGKEISLNTAVYQEIQNFNKANVTSKWFDEALDDFGVLCSGTLTPTMSDKERNKLKRKITYEAEVYRDGEFITERLFRSNADMPTVTIEDMVLNLYIEKYGKETKKGIVIRKDAPEAPLAYDYNSKTWVKTSTYKEPSKEEYEAYVAKLNHSWQIALEYYTSLNESELEYTDKMRYTAGAKKNTPDSIFDATIRSYFKHVKEHPEDANTPNAFLGVIHDLGSYFKNYLFSPYLKGYGDVVLMNGLANLGECGDGFGGRILTGSLLSSKVNMKYSGGHTFEGQVDWLYSGGHDDGFMYSDQTLGLVDRYRRVKYKDILTDLSEESYKELVNKYGITSSLKRSDFDSEEEYEVAVRTDVAKQAADIVKEYRRVARTQKRLMKLAGDYFKATTSKEQKAAILDKIAKADKSGKLLKEFKRLEADWKAVDKYDDPLGRAVKAYTEYDSNYEPETGNFAKDTFLYLATDPSLLFSLGVNTAVKKGSKSLAGEMFRSIRENVATKGLSRESYTFAKDIFAKDEKYFSKNFLTITDSELAARSNRAIDSLIKEGIVPAAQKYDYLKLYKTGFNEVQNARNYKLIKSMAGLQKVDDALNKAMLVTGLYLPASALYLYKGGRKLLHSNKLSKQFLTDRVFKASQDASRAYNAVKGLDGKTSILDVCDLVDNSELQGGVVDDYLLKKAMPDYAIEKKYINDLTNKVMSNLDVSGRALKKDIDAEISRLFVSRTSGVTPNSLDELKQLLEASRARLTNDNFSRYCDTIDDFLFSIDRLYDALNLASEKTTTNWLKVVKNAKTNTELKDLYLAYLKDTGHINVEVENLLINKSKSLTDPRSSFSMSDYIKVAKEELGYLPSHLTEKDLSAFTKSTKNKTYIPRYLDGTRINVENIAGDIESFFANYSKMIEDAADDSTRVRLLNHILHKDKVQDVLTYVKLYKGSDAFDLQILLGKVSDAYRDLVYDYEVRATQEFAKLDEDITGASREYYDLVHEESVLEDFDYRKIEDAIEEAHYVEGYDGEYHRTTLDMVTNELMEHNNGEFKTILLKHQFDISDIPENGIEIEQWFKKLKKRRNEALKATREKKYALAKSMQDRVYSVDPKTGKTVSYYDQYTYTVGAYNRLTSPELQKAMSYFGDVYAALKKEVSFIHTVEDEITSISPNKAKDLVESFESGAVYDVVSSVLDPSKPLGKLVANRDAYRSAILDAANLNTDVTRIEKLCDNLDEISRQAECYMTVKQFVDSIKNDNRFSVFEKVAIYEYIFGLTDNRRLADCVNRLRHINRLIDGVEDYVVSCSHTTRLDIGAAKNTMLSPSSSDDSIAFWGEKYISDVDTNSDLIAKLCESDLDVSIIQYLVRNKDAVSILDQYAQNGKVFFLDASLLGYNSDIDDILSIAMREYNGSSGSEGLKGLLSSVDSMKSDSYISKLSYDDYSNVSIDVIKKYYKNDRSKVNYTDEQYREAFIKDHCVFDKADRVTEEKILRDFVAYIDSFDGVPTFFIHDPDGLYVEFLKKKCAKYGIKSTKYGSLNDIFDRSINMFDELRYLESEKYQEVFTLDKKEAFTEYIVTLYNSLATLGNSYFFDIATFDKLFTDVRSTFTGAGLERDLHILASNDSLIGEAFTPGGSSTAYNYDRFIEEYRNNISEDFVGDSHFKSINFREEDVVPTKEEHISERMFDIEGDQVASKTHIKQTKNDSSIDPLTAKEYEDSIISGEIYNEVFEAFGYDSKYTVKYLSRLDCNDATRLASPADLRNFYEGYHRITIDKMFNYSSLDPEDSAAFVKDYIMRSLMEHATYGDLLQAKLNKLRNVRDVLSNQKLRNKSAQQIKESKLKNIDGLISKTESEIASKGSDYLETEFNAYAEFKKSYCIDNDSKVISVEYKYLDLYDYYHSLTNDFEELVYSNHNYRSLFDFDDSAFYKVSPDDSVKYGKAYSYFKEAKLKIRDSKLIDRDGFAGRDKPKLNGNYFKRTSAYRIKYMVGDLRNILSDISFKEGFNPFAMHYERFQRHRESLNDLLTFFKYGSFPSQLVDFVTSLRDLLNDFVKLSELDSLSERSFNDFYYLFLKTRSEAELFGPVPLLGNNFSEVLGNIGALFKTFDVDTVIRQLPNYSTLYEKVLFYREGLANILDSERWLDSVPSPKADSFKCYYGGEQVDFPSESFSDNLVSLPYVDDFISKMEGYIGGEIKLQDVIAAASELPRSLKNCLAAYSDLQSLLRAYSNSSVVSSRFIENLSDEAQKYYNVVLNCVKKFRREFALAGEAYYSGAIDIIPDDFLITFNKLMADGRTRFVEIACRLKNQYDLYVLDILNQRFPEFTEVRDYFRSDEYSAELFDYEGIYKGTAGAFKIQDSSCINATSFEGVCNQYPDFDMSISANPADEATYTGKPISTYMSDSKVQKGYDYNRINTYFDFAQKSTAPKIDTVHVSKLESAKRTIEKRLVELRKNKTYAYAEAKRLKQTFTAIESASGYVSSSFDVAMPEQFRKAVSTYADKLHNHYALKNELEDLNNVRATGEASVNSNLILSLTDSLQSRISTSQSKLFKLRSKLEYELGDDIIDIFDELEDYYDRLFNASYSEGKLTSDEVQGISFLNFHYAEGAYNDAIDKLFKVEEDIKNLSKRLEDVSAELYRINTIDDSTVGSVINPLDYNKLKHFCDDVDKLVNTSIRDLELIDKFDNFWVEIITSFKNDVSKLESTNPFNYLKNVKVPKTSKERFAVAKLLYDSFYKTLKHSSNIKFQKYTTYLNNISPAHRDAAYTLGLHCKNFTEDMENSLPLPVLQILNGDYDKLIFKRQGSQIGLPSWRVLRIDDPVSISAHVDYIAQQQKTFDTWASRFGNDTTSSRDYAVKTLGERVSDVLKMLDNFNEADPIFYKAAREYLDTIKSNIFDKSTKQVMDYITESEENLINHLAHHNQLLIVPRNGSDVYITSLNKLDNLLKECPEFVISKSDINYTYISFAYDTKLYTDGSQIKISYKDVEYDKVLDSKVFDDRYKDIPIPKYSDLADEGIYTTILSKYNNSSNYDLFLKQIDDFHSLLTTCYKQIDYISNGAIRGSSFTPYDMSRHRAVVNSLPTPFKAEMIQGSTTFDEAMFNRAQYDFCIIGDIDHRYKVASSDCTDILQDFNRCYEDFAGTASTMRMYIANYFDENCHSRLSTMLRSYTTKEKFEILKSAPDQCVVTLRENKNSFSGFSVHKYKIRDEFDVELAMRENAIVVPYDIYVEMTRLINETSFNKSYLKVWAQLVFFLKVGHLCNPGTWLRNWVDATIKASSETGSLGETLRGQLKALKLFADYNKIAKIVKDSSGDYEASLNVIEKGWDTYRRTENVDITFKEFQFLESWLKVTLSGGESAMVSNILRLQKKNPYSNKNLKKGSTRNVFTRKAAQNSFDLISNDIKRFEDLGVDEIEHLISLCEQSGRKKYSLFDDKFSKEQFFEIYNARLNDSSYLIDSPEFVHYKRVADTILRKRNTLWDKSLSGAYSKFNFLSSLCLKPMSKIEQVVRLGQYLTLESKNYTKSQIFKSIADTQFEYALKSTKIKNAELIMTYANFEYMNMRYWLNQLDSNPRFMFMLEKLWQSLSWEPCQNYTEAEDYYNNPSVAYMMTHGALPVGSKGLYLKMFPSALGALNWFYGLPSQYMQSVIPPLETLTKELFYQIGGDWAALVSNLDYSYADQTTFEKVLANVPIAGTIYTRYIKHYKNKPWRRLKGTGLPEALVKYNPSVFGAAAFYGKKDEKDFEAFQAELAEQGKWYDCNRCKVVDISQKNTIGLNKPNIGFPELKKAMFKYRGLVWDMNWSGFVDGSMKYGHFTPYGDLDYKFGGLNRTFDFSREGEFDRFEDLEWKYHGRKWDGNTQKFISGNLWKKEGLNKDFDFENDPNAWAEWNYELNNHGFYYDTEEHKIKKLTKDEQRFVNAYNSGYYYRGYREFKRWLNYSHRPPAVTNKKYGGNVIKSGNKIYSRPYTSSGDYSAFRMAVSGYKNYDSYYQYEYKYNYSYRHPNPLATVRRYNPIIRYHIT